MKIFEYFLEELLKGFPMEIIDTFLEEVIEEFPLEHPEVEVLIDSLIKNPLKCPGETPGGILAVSTRIISCETKGISAGSLKGICKASVW